MAVIGYIRVSTDKQTCEHQKYEIKQFAKAQKVKITYWVEETISSRKSLDKRKLGKMIDHITREKPVFKQCGLCLLKSEIK